MGRRQFAFSVLVAGMLATVFVAGRLTVQLSEPATFQVRWQLPSGPQISVVRTETKYEFINSTVRNGLRIVQKKGESCNLRIEGGTFYAAEGKPVISISSEAARDLGVLK